MNLDVIHLFVKDSNDQNRCVICDSGHRRINLNSIVLLEEYIRDHGVIELFVKNNEIFEIRHDRLVYRGATCISVKDIAEMVENHLDEVIRRAQG